MSGWDQPAATPPPDDTGSRSHWSDQDTDPFGPGRLIRRGWRLYRTMPRRLLAVAAITGIVQTALALPGLATYAALMQSMFDVMADWFGAAMANPGLYRYTDQATLQADLDARLRAVILPNADLAGLIAVGSGIGGAVGLVGVAALTATALSVAAGRPIPVAFAFRLVVARAGLVIPIVALGIGWTLVSFLSLAVQTSPAVQDWVGATGSPRSVLIGSLLGILALILVVGILYLAVRWALFVPVVLVEALGVGPGLARAAALTRGIRVRLGLAMAGVVVATVLVVGLASTAVGIAVGLSARSFGLGVAAYFAVGLAGNVLVAPWMPAMLAAAYRERTLPSDAPDPGSPSLS